MADNLKHSLDNKFDLGIFLKSHTEEELILLRNLVDKLVFEKRKEKEIETSIPISIFSKGLNPAEAAVKFLKENKALRLSVVSKLLNKKENAVWLNYNRAKQKMKARFDDGLKDEIHIPIYVFKTPVLSYLESIVLYLRDEMNLSNNKIAILLEKSPQVLSISYNRAKSKLKNE